MTKKLPKKLISIFLSLLMVLSLIPTGMMTAFAEDETQFIETIQWQATKTYGDYFTVESKESKDAAWFNYYTDSIKITSNTGKKITKLVLYSRYSLDEHYIFTNLPDGATLVKQNNNKEIVITGLYTTVFKLSLNTMSFYIDKVDIYGEPHTCVLGSKITGQAATDTVSGWKDYYQCTDPTCARIYGSNDTTGKFYANLDSWKKSAEGRIKAANAGSDEPVLVETIRWDGNKTEGVDYTVKSNFSKYSSWEIYYKNSFKVTSKNGRKISKIVLYATRIAVDDRFVFDLPDGATVTKTEENKVVTIAGLDTTEFVVSVGSATCYINRVDIYELFHEHTDNYALATTTVANDTLSYYCSEDSCPSKTSADKPATLTLSASDAEYTGSAYTGATLGSTDSWTAAGLTTPKIKYFGRGETDYPESETAPTAIGEYTATISAGDKVVAADFEITKLSQTAPTAGEGYTLSYSAETLVAANDYEISSTDGDTATALTDNKVTPGSTYYVRKAENDTKSPSSWTSFTLAARPAAPTGLGSVKPSATGVSDGKITGVTSAMEYKLSTATSWTAITGTQVTGLAAGTYKVRTKATSSAFAGNEATVTIVDPHTHTYATTWTTDATQHWHAATCEHTTEKGSLGNHSGGSATCTAAAVCSTCGASYGSALGHSYATTWSSDDNQHWYAATCEHNTLKKDTANHTYGTEGAARYTCTVCSAVNEAKKLQFAKADAKAAIDAYLGESDNAEAIAIANKAKQDIDAATTVEDVNDIKDKALEDIKDIIAPDFATLKKDVNYDGEVTKLAKDYTRGEDHGGVVVGNGEKVIIDLNGHTIDGANDFTVDYGFIFAVNPGGELVIMDSTDNKGVITGGTGYYDSNSERRTGGAIYNLGTVTIDGGTFTGGVVTDGSVIDNRNTATVNGGVFTGNTATSQGGAIDNYGKNAVLVVTGGTFTNNKANFGGAIENSYGAVVTITGGTFTGNVAKSNGGAIDTYNATLNIGGSPVIKDNMVDENVGTENEGNGIVNNFEFEGGTVALADTAFTEDAEIGVTITAKTDTLIAEGATLDTLKALKSDDATKMFIVDNGAVKIMNIADHVHAGGTATCQVLKVCQSCGASYGTYAQHSYTNYVPNYDATCTEDGTKTADCDYECGATSTITDEGTATGHHYTEEVTTAPTYNKQGETTYTCTCGNSYKEPIARLKVTAAIKYANSTRMDTGLILTSSKTDATIKWGKVADADGYMIYAAYCGNDAKLIKTIKGADTKSYKFAKLDGKAIDLTKNIKAYVVAYKVIDGKKVEFGQTIVAHAIGSQSKKYTNPVEVTVKSDKVTLSQGKTSTINATVTYKDASKKAISDAHSPEKRYRSSKKAVATVDKDGKITAVGKGTCTIYVFAKNGVSTKITVTVK